MTLNLEPFEYVQKFCSHLVANAVLNLKLLLGRGWPVNKISKLEAQICIPWSWTCWAMWEDTCTCDGVWSKYLKWGNDKHLWQLHSSPPPKKPKSPHVWCVRLDRAAYLALKKGGESLMTSALQESLSKLESQTGKPEFLLLWGNVKIFFKTWEGLVSGEVWGLLVTVMGRRRERSGSLQKEVLAFDCMRKWGNVFSKTFFKWSFKHYYVYLSWHSSDFFLREELRFLAADYLECRYTLFIFFLELLRSAVLFVILAFSSQTFV